MTFSGDFFDRTAGEAGIFNLMEDLGHALSVNPDLLFLGGGNPAYVPQFEARVAECLHQIAGDPLQLRRLVGVYQSPQGSEHVIELLAKYFADLGWPVGAENICITNGSQSAFFLLFNMLTGQSTNRPARKICLPMLPEYLGYADQGIADATFACTLPLVEEIGDHTFKYHVDFDRLDIDDRTAAICVSRPTNPSANVFTGAEMAQLGLLADERGIPFIVDCAYGNPFPGIVYTQHTTRWRPNRVFVLSLSKLGLPGARTGIVVADEPIVKALARANTVVSLASGNLGPSLISALLSRGELDAICRDMIRPFYSRKRDFMLRCVAGQFAGINYRIHLSEGAFFLWLWFPGLPITSTELYLRLKDRGVLVMDGSHFFFDQVSSWKHASECIRLSYCQSDEVLEKAVSIIADELRLVFSQN